jgi:hypothetical protein
MAYKARYGKMHLYDESVTHAEEKSFLENYQNPMIQLDPLKVMLVISHSENTFNKNKMREDKNNPYMKTTSLKIRDIIKDKTLREFYSKA